MTKFHINKKGIPALCRAKDGNCPLGGNDQHFGTKDEAQSFVDKEGQRKHGLLGVQIDQEHLKLLGIESEEKAMKIMNKAAEWANSEAAERFVETGEIEDTKLKDSDILRENVWDIKGYLNKLPFQTPSQEEIEQFSHIEYDLPPESPWDNEYELVSLSPKERALLEELGEIDDAENRNIIIYKTEYDEYKAYNTMDREGGTIDPYELAIAKSGSTNAQRKGLVENLKTIPNTKGLIDFKNSDFHAQHLNRVYYNKFVGLPKSYLHVKDLVITDPKGMLNEDLSINVEPGEYRAIYNDGVLDVNVYAKEGSASHQFSQQFYKNDALIESENLRLSVIEVDGKKIYDTFNSKGSDYEFGTLLVPEETYQKLVSEGEIDEDMYGAAPTIKIKKPTALSLDPDLGSNVWNEDYKELKGNHGYGFHFKDNDAYEESTGWLSKSYNRLMNKQEE